MNRFGVIGLGKMGQNIASLLASDPGVEFDTFSRISPANKDQLKTCDVVIEFTTPEAAPRVIRECIEAGITIVSGTTGWHKEHLSEVINVCKSNNGKLLYATNFSIGMNITFALNQKLSEIMNRFPQFYPSIHEVHHVHKKDAPSGTALTLAEDILKNYSVYTESKLVEEVQRSATFLQITALREGEVKGYHEINWQSDLEKISLTHEAFDRKIFAEGAIVAAHWLIDKSPGVYTMRDIIKLL